MAFLSSDVAEVYLDIEPGEGGLLVEQPVQRVIASTQVDNLTLLVGQR